MGTRRGVRAGAVGGTEAKRQDATKAPRMAQDGLAPSHECLLPSPRPEAVLGQLWRSGGGVEGHAPAKRVDGGIVLEETAQQPVSSPARQTDCWKPEPLSWPERHPFDLNRIDDKARWTAAVSLFLGMVGRLCRERRREFPATKYLASGSDGLRERVALLQQFGGLPKSVDCLNSVPAEALEGAVGAFAECFGYDREDAASGPLAGTGNVPTEPDPTPRRSTKRSTEVPW